MTSSEQILELIARAQQSGTAMGTLYESEDVAAAMAGHVGEDDPVRVLAYGESTGNGWQSLGYGVVFATDERVVYWDRTGTDSWALDEVQYASKAMHKGLRLSIGRRPRKRSLELLRIAAVPSRQEVIEFLHTKGKRRTTTPGSAPVVVAATRLDALGGQFAGNVREIRGVPSPHVKPGGPNLALTSDDKVQIGVKIGRGWYVTSEYPVDSPALALDHSTTIARAIRGGWLAGTAAATLALGPIGLVGLLKSSRSVTKDTYVLVLADGAEQTAFALHDGGVGRLVQARRAELEAKAASPSGYEAFVEVPETGTPTVEASGAIPPPPAVPAGWYPSPNGIGKSYWDGARWTGDTAP